MNVHIPHIEHKVYTTTFLERVGITLKFKEEDPESFRKYNSYFENVFNIALSEWMFDIMKFKHLSIKSSPEAFTYKFSKGYIRLIVEGASYESFAATVNPCLEKMIGLVKSLNGTIVSFEIRKINMWPSAELSLENTEKYMADIFSPSLMEEYERSTGLREDETLLITKQILDRNGDAGLFVTLGAIVENEESEKNRLILDTEAITQDMPSLMPDCLLSTAIEMNDALFDLFHWCVKKEVINRMSENKKLETYEV